MDEIERGLKQADDLIASTFSLGVHGGKDVYRVSMGDANLLVALIRDTRAAILAMDRRASLIAGPIAYMGRGLLDALNEPGVEYLNCAAYTKSGIWMLDEDQRVAVYASPAAVCDVATMHTSSGIPDYFARVTVGDRSLEFFMSKIKGQAEYHAAELDWLLNGAEKPDILGFDYTEPPGLADYLAARASPPAPAVAVPVGAIDALADRFQQVRLREIRDSGLSRAEWYATRMKELFVSVPVAPAPTPPAAEGDAVTLTYTNWRRETAERSVVPRGVWFGATEWHPEPQWLLRAIDVEKQAERDFALKDFGTPPAAEAPGQEPVAVKPLDLGNVLRHAFLSGVTAARSIPAHEECVGPDLWPAYEPYEPGSYDRIRSALVSAPTTYADAEAKGDGWMPIETAPPEGHFIAAIWVRHINGNQWWEQHILWLDDETGGVHIDCDQGWRLDDYAAWRALPPPPASSLRDHTQQIANRG